MVESRVYPAGSFVVLMAQPNKPFAWALLEKQKYPDMREYAGGPPVVPYDNAAWTLPLQMGVLCDQIDKPFTAELEKIEQTPAPEVKMPGESPAWLVFDSRVNASFAAAFALLKDKAEIYRSKEKVAGEGFEAAPGSFLVKNSPAVQKALPAAAGKAAHVTVRPLADAAAVPKSALKNPRIGLYQSWWSSMDEGWTRYMFDDLGIPYTTLHNADFKAPKSDKSKPRTRTRNRPRSTSRPSTTSSSSPASTTICIKTGKIDPSSPWARWFTPLPPEYEGGLEKEGVDNLKAFVENGGILVTLNDACKLAFKDFEPPARDILDKPEQAKFFCPMSILKLMVDNASPIGYGMGDTAAAVFNGQPGDGDVGPADDRMGPEGRGQLSRGQHPAQRMDIGRGDHRPQGRRGRHQIQERAHHPDRHRLPVPGPVARNLQVPAQRAALPGDAVKETKPAGKDPAGIYIRMTIPPGTKTGIAAARRS